MKYGKFWSISLELFVKHKPWNWEEWSPYLHLSSFMFFFIVYFQIMIAIAWAISLLLCIPQVLIFYYDENEQFCKAFFIKGWGVKAYVLWFTFSNFLLPLVILLFCYTRICYTIWDNVNSKSDVKKVDFWERLKKLSPWQSCQHRQR